jgi:hypothetical protein
LERPTALQANFGSSVAGRGRSEDKPFKVSMDNGILNEEGSTVGSFAEGYNCVLRMILVPARTREATLSVVGP